MADPHAYSVTVRRIVDDGETMFEARIREFPDLAEYADSADEAYALAIEAIEAVGALCAKKGKAMPAVHEVPTDFSGRVTLRLPRSLHRALAETAQEEEVSLNQHLVNVLSYFTGFAHADRAQADKWVSTKIAPRQSSHLRLVSSSPLQAVESREQWPRHAAAGRL